MNRRIRMVVWSKAPDSRHGLHKKGNDSNAQRDRKMCCKCSHSHGGECMVEFNGCYRCGKSRPMVRDYPNEKNQAKADTQPRPNPTAVDEPPKRNRVQCVERKS